MTPPVRGVERSLHRAVVEDLALHVHGCSGGEEGGGGCGGGRGCGGSCGCGGSGKGVPGGGGVGGDGGAAVHWSTSFCVARRRRHDRGHRVAPQPGAAARARGARRPAVRRAARGGGGGGTSVPSGTAGTGGGGGGGKGECGGGGGLGLGGGGRAAAAGGGGGGRGACEASTAEPSPEMDSGAEPPSESSAGEEKSSQSAKMPPRSATSCTPGVQKGRGGDGVVAAPATSGLSSSARGVVSTVTGLTTLFSVLLLLTTTTGCTGGAGVLGPGSTSGSAGTRRGDWFGRSRRSVGRSNSPLVAAGFFRHAVKDSSIALLLVRAVR